MRIAKLFAACLAAASLLISCTEKNPELQGSWELDTIDGQTVTTSEKPAYISFDVAKSRVNGCLGVNLFMGGYSFEDGKLSFGDLGTTMMLGNPSDMEVESSFQKVLDATSGVKVKGETLSLLDENSKVLATLTKRAAEQAE